MVFSRCAEGKRNKGYKASTAAVVVLPMLTKLQSNGTLRLVGMMCLTLGLAPFLPEPHILGKLRWVMGGANGMEAADYFDLIFHGFPWILLIFILALRLVHLLSGKSAK